MANPVNTNASFTYPQQLTSFYSAPYTQNTIIPTNNQSHNNLNQNNEYQQWQKQDMHEQKNQHPSENKDVDDEIESEFECKKRKLQQIFESKYQASMGQYIAVCHIYNFQNSFEFT